jgi:hypothetical protein
MKSLQELGSPAEWSKSSSTLEAFPRSMADWPEVQPATLVPYGDSGAFLLGRFDRVFYFILFFSKLPCTRSQVSVVRGRLIIWLTEVLPRFKFSLRHLVTPGIFQS